MNVISVVLVALMSVCAGPAQGLLQKMQEKMNSMGCVEISVSLDENDAVVVSDGHRYHLTSDVTEVWCDGTDQWIYSPASNELTVTAYDDSSADIFENPAAVLTSDITKTYNVVSENNGQVVLKAKKNIRVSYPNLVIKVGSSGLPQLITLTSAAGETYHIKVNSVKSVQSPSSESFTPSQTLLKTSFVNDLR